jgi:hypothetical protein
MKKVSTKPGEKDKSFLAPPIPLMNTTTCIGSIAAR